MRENSLWKKGTAAARFLAYRGVRIPVLGYWGASLGVALLILIAVVFFLGVFYLTFYIQLPKRTNMLLAMTLGPRPYYWPNTDTVSYGSSPPIATRTGWMAVALLPFVL